MKPVTPLCACEVFVLNENEEVLLIERSDNQTWALPGGCHDLNETPKECAERECWEESGFKINVTDLIGVYSSNRYEYKYYPYKDNQFCHMLFKAEITGGSAKTSSETLRVGWFKQDQLPLLNDGHDFRIRHGFEFCRGRMKKPYFE